MNVLITGADGQLGYELRRTAPDFAQLSFTDYQQLDITDEAAIQAFFASASPAVVINAAAYTAVDKAELDVDTARAVNATGAALLARACADHNIPMLQVSTDFVFDGAQSSPYHADDQPHPLSVYGQTKLEGENHVRELLPQRSLIIRTAWVYSAHGNNFVKTMLRLMQEKEQLGVVADQVGTPTWANHLARCVWNGVVRLLEGSVQLPVHHFTDAGVASWYDFAVAIQEEALQLGLLDKAIQITPIQTLDYPTPATRPAYSVLDKTSTWAELEAPQVHWRVALRQMLAELVG
ncbi:dTDP-4-dehydrorhamnose reductase [Endozoicomonas elysicola]|uniref:dTDP-4-dehydrorhamnose reductase n=1 Tax=Endozoicomonas elysicola TaxID=305900 RepID=A0A081K9D7_9GAMM|nr:dTDP-4-dehydrorhamnose reductase [Endozoicomonas elysicola]KEI70763.1 dTDP-4-dehydrorhamnose reductase [Endozoicomonas elysicola]